VLGVLTASPGWGGMQVGKRHGLEGVGVMPVTRRATIGNLAFEMTSFVGRVQALGEVNRLLSESRLVTLTGAGGTGKTRLALRVAAQRRRAIADGVWFVDLTQLTDSPLLTQNAENPDELAFLVTATLGLRERSDGTALGTLVEQLADRQLLLILDNCEHLLPATAILAAALLRGCPGVRMLATSREPLIISGERLFPVPPLLAPDPGLQLSLADVIRCESVSLFLARAQAVVPGFALTADNQFAVAELCYRLDGLPLAIELAAARVRVLGPQQILDRLAGRFNLLSGSTRGVPERQRTLRACVDWSFDLCTEPERTLWARLSVFAGGFELDAVEGVCTDEDLPPADALAMVTSLVDKSILVRSNVGDGAGNGQAEAARYRMLETIRDYGQEKLIEAGEDLALRRRHRDWCQRLAARAGSEWISDRQAYWVARLGREHPNLRVAIEFCLTEPGEAEAALRLMGSLPQSYWPAGGLFGEGRRWLDRALAQATATTTLRARALLDSSHLATVQGDTAAGIRLLNEGEELARRLGGTVELGHAAFLRGLGALFANDLPVAVENLTRAWAILSEVADLDLDLYLQVLRTFGVASGLSGDQQRASTCVQEMLSIVEPRGEGRYRSAALWVGGLTAWLRRDLPQGVAHLVECLRLKRAWGSEDLYVTAWCLEVLAWIAADQQRHRPAATLLGAANALWRDIGSPIAAARHLVGFHHACERQIRDALGNAAYTDAYHHGHVLTSEDAIAYALDEPPQPAPVMPKDTPTSLTRREREIVELLAGGRSNKDIAARLFISQRTAEGHVEHILTKLGFTSRASVAAWVAAQRTNGHDT